MTVQEEVKTIQDLEVGQKLVCKKSWVSVLDPLQAVDEGSEYTIVHKEVLPYSSSPMFRFMFRTWGGDVEFFSFEISKFFVLPELKDNNKPKCDCGFIVGESAAHYRWCDTLQVII